MHHRPAHQGIPGRAPFFNRRIEGLPRALQLIEVVLSPPSGLHQFGAQRLIFHCLQPVVGSHHAFLILPGIQRQLSPKHLQHGVVKALRPRFQDLLGLLEGPLLHQVVDTLHQIVHVFQTLLLFFRHRRCSARVSLIDSATDYTGVTACFLSGQFLSLVS